MLLILLKNCNILIKWRNMHARPIRQNQGQSRIRLSIEYYSRVIRKGADEDEDEFPKWNGYDLSSRGWALLSFSAVRFPRETCYI